MALVLKDRVKEQTATTGTGTVTLAGAVTDFDSFSVIGDGNTTYYTITLPEGDEWEVGLGTYTASGTTLSRDTILASSNSGSAVNFSAGNKDVFVVYPAGKSVYEDASGNVTAGGSITGEEMVASNGVFVNNKTISVDYTVPSGYNATSTGPVTVSAGTAFTVPSGSRWLVL
jgi:hypothetical protein